MLSSPLSFARMATIAVLLVAWIVPTSGLDIKYCSSDNTASTGKNSSLYQSNGLCYNFCVDDYAFAVLQDNGCWCSNYVPADTVSSDDCSTPCPGYPADICGGDDLYGYISLTKAASGTAGAASTSASKETVGPVTLPAATVTETPAAVTVFLTPTQSSAPETSSSSSSSTTSTSTVSTTASSTPSTTPSTISTTVAPAHTKSASTTSSTSSTWTPTPVVSLETVTGQVRTVTVTPTIPPAASSVSKSDDKKGLGTGGAVGLTIGLVAVVALISGIVFFYLRRKKKDEEAERAANSSGERRDSAGTTGGVPSRTMSENSRYVLGTDGRGQVVETWQPDTAVSRGSRLLPVDPRLDAFSGLYQAENKSRESVNTVRDDHDYSRRVHQPKSVLRAMNPDTDDDD